MNHDTIEGEIVGTAVAVRQEPVSAAPSLFTAMRPAEKVAYATEVAGVLKDVLVQRQLIKRIGQSDHVELEGWQTCGSIVGVSAKVEWTRALEGGNGWECRAVVITAQGIEVGAGEGMCSRDETSWKKRDDFALRAMAQTRAMSRALRGVLAWIVVLAGYKPTPAEEMGDIPAARSSQPSDDAPARGQTLTEARTERCAECNAPAGRPHATKCKTGRPADPGREDVAAGAIRRPASPIPDTATPSGTEAVREREPAAASGGGETADEVHRARLLKRMFALHNECGDKSPRQRHERYARVAQQVSSQDLSVDQIVAVCDDIEFEMKHREGKLL